MHSKFCLSDKKGDFKLVKCDFFDASQQWLFNNYTSYYTQMTTPAFRGESMLANTITKLITFAEQQKWDKVESIIYHVDSRSSLKPQTWSKFKF